MKVSKSQVQANRERIVASASTLFRARGFDGIGVADLMAAAGFTHGGFYRHFASKEDLMAEAASLSLATSLAQAQQSPGTDYLQQYLSREHRDNPGDGCTFAALAGDAARQPEQVKAAFEAGLAAMLSTIAGAERGRGGRAQQVARAKLLATFAQLVGAIVLSRACPDDSPLADEVLEAVRAAVSSNSGDRR